MIQAKGASAFNTADRTDGQKGTADEKTIPRERQKNKVSRKRKAGDLRSAPDHQCGSDDTCGTASGFCRVVFWEHISSDRDEYRAAVGDAAFFSVRAGALYTYSGVSFITGSYGQKCDQKQKGSLGVLALRLSLIHIEMCIRDSLCAILIKTPGKHYFVRRMSINGKTVT